MANRHFREKSAEEAWNRVNEIFPTDYAKDEDSSQRAGYPIFRSTADGYMEFRPYDSGWRLNRYRCDSTPVAQYEYQEKIALEEEK